MAGGTSRGKSPRKAGAQARPRRPALGNDPFERGAAVREPAQPGAAETPVATPSPRPSPPADAGGEGEVRATSTVTSTPTPTPTPTATATETATSAETPIGPSRASLAALEAEAREAVARLLPAFRARLGTLFDLVRLLEPAERLDRFGMDERFAHRIEPLIEFLYGSWWRVQVRGISAVPASGPAVVVANHGGLVPWDAFVLRHALRHDHPARRELRPLIDDREAELPVVGAAAIRAGAVRATPEAADRVLAAGDVLGVFPEGSAGARKPWRDRYTLVRFGRGGFVKVALRAGAPIVPCAIVGSEETSAGISRTGWLAERLGVPILAANSALRLAPAAALPLPARWTLRFGDPIEVAGLGREAADDPAVVNGLAERARSAIQSMLDEDVASRTSVFL